MKKLIVMLAMIASFVLAGGGITEVKNVSTKILAAPKSISSSTWTQGQTYKQGEVVSVGSTKWFCLKEGTSNIKPSGISDFTDGSLVWRKVITHKRKGLFVANEGTERITIFWTKNITAGNGITLAKGEKVTQDTSTLEDPSIVEKLEKMVNG